MKAKPTLRHGFRQSAVVELTVVLERLPFPYLQDEVNRLVQALARFAEFGVQPEQLGVGRWSARSDAKIDAPLRHVVEHGDAVRDMRRVVVVQQRHARAEFHLLRNAQRPRDEQLRRRHVLPRQREMLANPSLTVAQPVRVRHQLKVFLVSLVVRSVWVVQGHQKKA